jgi:beta-glucanase (GH16 family)
MKVAGGPGVISAIYTYTDPIEGSGHYENDFEFPAGSDKRSRAQMNYYGPSADPTVGDLTFLEMPKDPSTDFNDYTIEVYKDKSIWKINDKVVRTRTSPDGNRAERVLLNTWFNREWINFYKDVRFSFVTPLEVESVDVSSLENSQ